MEKDTYNNINLNNCNGSLKAILEWNFNPYAIEDDLFFQELTQQDKKYILKMYFRLIVIILIRLNFKFLLL